MVPTTTGPDHQYQDLNIKTYYSKDQPENGPKGSLSILGELLLGPFPLTIVTQIMANCKVRTLRTEINNINNIYEVKVPQYTSFIPYFNSMASGDNSAGTLWNGSLSLNSNQFIINSSAFSP